MSDERVNGGESMSDKTTLKWIEKILIPILVAGFMALSTCAVRSNETITKLEEKAEAGLEARVKTEEVLDSMKSNQQTMQLQVNTMQTHQQHIIDDLNELKTDLKEQNNAVLEAIKELQE